MARGKTNYGGGGVDTSDATAVASDILDSKTAYGSAGTKLTGTMVDRGTVNITPGTSNQAIEAGKHSGSGVVYGDADLTAGNIAVGVTIFGVTGTLPAAPSLDAGNTAISDTGLSGAYYRKYGKLYMFTGQAGQIRDTTANKDRLITLLGITVNTWILAAATENIYWYNYVSGVGWNGDTRSNSYRLIGVLTS